jgi:hypothetical protein
MNPKRAEFIANNRSWIDFLNWQPGVTNVTPIEENINLPMIAKYFSSEELEFMESETRKEYQIWNQSTFDIFVFPGAVLKSDHLEMLKQMKFYATLRRKTKTLADFFDNKFASELELLYEIRKWMRQNLKAVGNGKKALCFNETFLLEDFQKIFRQMYVGINPDSTKHKELIFFETISSNQSIITVFPGFLLPFVKYLGIAMRDEIKNSKVFFKVGICPYQKRKEKECGLVYVGEKWDQQACKEHCHKWHALNGKRKERLRKSCAIL